MEHITELSYTVDKLRPCQAVQAYFSVFFFLMEYTCTLLCIELTVQFEPYNNLQISMHVNALYHVQGVLQYMGQFLRKCPMFYDIITIKRRSVRTVNAVDFLFSPHDATPSLYG